MAARADPGDRDHEHIYVIALWLTGVEFALPIGIITGFAVVVPYVSVLVGPFLAAARN